MFDLYDALFFIGMALTPCFVAPYFTRHHSQGRSRRVGADRRLTPEQRNRRDLHLAERAE
jgi:hypothetical protein